MKRLLILVFLLALSASAFGQTGKAKRSDGTECAAFPCVVASVALLSQNAAVSQAPVFTPTVSGLFRISGYLESSPVKNSVWGPSFNWADDIHARKIPYAVITPGQYTDFGASLPVRAAAGQPITYTVRKGTNNPLDATYNLFITVEQLQ